MKTKQDIMNEFDELFGGIGCNEKPTKCYCSEGEHEVRGILYEFEEWLSKTLDDLVDSMPSEERKRKHINEKGDKLLLEAMVSGYNKHVQEAKQWKDNFLNP